jgi:GT2 family glycosyltransferase
MLTASIIVHQDYSHISRALDTLLNNAAIPMTVYVTINSGYSSELAQLQSAYPSIRFRINANPKGFAANHNAIMAIAATPYIALLNDDIEIPPGMISTLVNHLESNSEVGLVTPLVLNPDGTQQLNSFNDPTLMRMIYKISGLGHWTRHGSWLRNLLVSLGLNRIFNVSSLDNHSDTHDVPVAVGVAMFVRRKAYEQAGLMDEDTLVYGEEYGWHRRIRQAGWKIRVVSETHITHFNAVQNLKGWQLVEHRKGMLSYFYRYQSHWQAILIRISLIVLHSLRAMLSILFIPGQFKSEIMVVKLAIGWKSTPVPLN